MRIVHTIGAWSVAWIGLASLALCNGVIADDNTVPGVQNTTYQSLRITAPRHNSAFWSAPGTVIIKAVSEPPVQPGSGHTINMYMDGILVGTGPAVALTGVNRGTHSAYAQIIDARGKPIITSQEILFTLHQPSVPLP